MSVTLATVEDTSVEPDETVILDVSAVSNAVESSTQQLTLTIGNDGVAATPTATPTPVVRTAVTTDAEGREVLPKLPEGGSIVTFVRGAPPAGTDFPAGYYELQIDRIAPGSSVTAIIDFPPQIDIREYLGWLSLLPLLGVAVLRGRFGLPSKPRQTGELADASFRWGAARRAVGAGAADDRRGAAGAGVRIPDF